MEEQNKEQPIVLSVGGSLVVPNGGIDTDFLTKFNAFIRRHVKNGKRFFLVVGGGKICRHYQDAAREVVGNPTDTDIDWLGIHATRLNAHLVRTIFQDIAHPRIIENYDTKLTDWNESVVVGSGWKPGWSTDYDTVILARDYGAKIIVNMSNVEYIYDKDPKKHPDAKKLTSVAWSEMSAIVGTVWSPGANTPFDPIAAKLAAEHKLTVIVANGTNFENLEKIVSGDSSFEGTTIHP